MAARYATARSARNAIWVEKCPNVVCRPGWDGISPGLHFSTHIQSLTGLIGLCDLGTTFRLAGTPSPPSTPQTFPTQTRSTPLQTPRHHSLDGRRSRFDLC